MTSERGGTERQAIVGTQSAMSADPDLTKPPRPDDTPASVGINPVPDSEFPNTVVVTGWTNPGQTWFWQSGDNAWESKDLVTFSGVTVLLGSGQTVVASPTAPKEVRPSR